MPKAGMQLDALSAELLRQLETKEDYVVDTRRVGWSTEIADEGRPSTTLTIDDAEDDGALGVFSVTDYTHGQVADTLGIPKRYYDRMRDEQPALLDHNVRTWLREQPKKRMVRTLDGRARAFLSDRYHRIDNYDVAEIALPILSEIADVEIASASLTETKLYLKATFPSIQRTIKSKRGDVIQAGVIIENSEVGAAAFKVAPFSLVLKCVNGMTHMEWGDRRVHSGGKLEEGRVAWRDDTLKAADEAFKLEVRDIVHQVATAEAFSHLVDELALLPEMEIEGDPVASVEKLAKKTGLSDTEEASVLRHLVKGGDLSAWGFVNAVTRASQDVESYDRASELEALGGELAASNQDEWKALVAA